jgi:hypothetical protein
VLGGSHDVKRTGPWLAWPIAFFQGPDSPPRLIESLLWYVATSSPFEEIADHMLSVFVGTDEDKSSAGQHS